MQALGCLFRILPKFYIKIHISGEKEKPRFYHFFCGGAFCIGHRLLVVCLGSNPAFYVIDDDILFDILRRFCDGQAQVVVAINKWRV